MACLSVPLIKLNSLTHTPLPPSFLFSNANFLLILRPLLRAFRAVLLRRFHNRHLHQPSQRNWPIFIHHYETGYSLCVPRASTSQVVRVIVATVQPRQSTTRTFDIMRDNSKLFAGVYAGESLVSCIYRPSDNQHAYTPAYGRERGSISSLDCDSTE